MKRPPRQVRLEEEIESEVKKIAEVTDLPEIEIIRQAVKAGVLAIKENDYQLPLPLRLAVVKSGEIPSKNAGSSNVAAQPGGVLGQPGQAAKVKRPAA